MTSVFPEDSNPEPPEDETQEFTAEQVKGASLVTNVWMVGLVLIVLFVIFCLVYKLSEAIGIIPWR